MVSVVAPGRGTIEGAINVTGTLAARRELTAFRVPLHNPTAVDRHTEARQRMVASAARVMPVTVRVKQPAVLLAGDRKFAVPLAAAFLVRTLLTTPPQVT